MKTPFRIRALIAVTLFTTLALPLSASPLGTAFTYHGHLTQEGSPAEGIYDLRFAIYDSDDGSGWLGVITNAATEVSSGVFVVTLDFGAGVFDGDARWLEIGVRTNGSAAGFTALSPRQALTPTPYALYSPSSGVAASAVVANSIEPNAVGNASLQDGSITTDKILDDTITSADIGMLDDLDINYYLNIGGDIELGGQWSALNWNRYWDGADRYRADGYAGMLQLNADYGGFQWVAAPAGLAGQVINWNVVRLSQEGHLGIGAWLPQARLEVVGNPRVDNDEVPQLRLTGGGYAGALSLLDLATYPPGTNAPAARIQATDDGNASAGVDILTKEPGSLDNPLVSRLHIAAGGNVGINTSNPLHPVSNAKLRVAGGHVVVDHNFGLLSVNSSGTSFGAGIDSTADDSLQLLAGGNNVRIQINGSPDGNVGIGTLSPDAKLDVAGSAHVQSILKLDSSIRLASRNLHWISIYADTKNPNEPWMVFDMNTADSCRIDILGNFYCRDVKEYSDARLKRNITPLRNVLDSVCALRGVTFDWAREVQPDEIDSTGRQIGLIAQDVEDLFPELVGQDQEGKLTVSYTHLVPVLVEAIKEQRQRTDSMVAEKDVEIEALKRRLERLEQLLSATRP